VDNFVKEKNRALLIVDNDVPKLVDRLSSFSARTTTIER